MAQINELDMDYPQWFLNAIYYLFPPLQTCFLPLETRYPILPSNIIIKLFFRCKDDKTAFVQMLVWFVCAFPQFSTSISKVIKLRNQNPTATYHALKGNCTVFAVFWLTITCLFPRSRWTKHHDWSTSKSVTDTAIMHFSYMIVGLHQLNPVGFWPWLSKEQLSELLNAQWKMWRQSHSFVLIKYLLSKEALPILNHSF